MSSVYIKTDAMKWPFFKYFNSKGYRIRGDIWDNCSIIIKARSNEKDNISPDVLLNHINESNLLTGKFSFFNIVKDYSFYPRTFVSNLNDLEIKDNDMFIVRRKTERYNKGSLLLRKNTYINKRDESEYLVQRYIKNPFLLDGRKTDIRVYIMSYMGHYYIFSKIVIMTSEKTYDINSNDMRVHSTNPVTSEIKLLSTVRPDINKEVHFKACAYLTNVLSNVPRSKDKNRFEIFGVDFLLDDNLNLWLLDINCNPVFRDGEYFSGIYRELVNETLDFVINDRFLGLSFSLLI